MYALGYIYIFNFFFCVCVFLESREDKAVPKYNPVYWPGKKNKPTLKPIIVNSKPITDLLIHLSCNGVLLFFLNNVKITAYSGN